MNEGEGLSVEQLSFLIRGFVAALLLAWGNSKTKPEPAGGGAKAAAIFNQFIGFSGLITLPLVCLEDGMFLMEDGMLEMLGIFAIWALYGRAAYKACK